MRHRCQEAPSKVAATAATSPEGASEATTPDRTRGFRPRNRVDRPAGLQLGPADVHGQNIAAPIGVNTVATRTWLLTNKEFRKSIKERGVLEAVTVYRNGNGQSVLLRGQRRTVTAAEVGTPTGLIPARVVPQAADADRIGDQMVENIHRAGCARPRSSRAWSSWPCSA